MRQLIAAALFSTALLGCSTAPRAFTPELADPTAAGPTFDAAVEQCTELVSAGVRTNFLDYPVAAGAAGAVAGYSAGGVIFFAGLESSAIASAATASLIAMPVVGILVAASYANRARSRREREIKGAMSQCLAEHGYTVERWQLQPTSHTR